MLVGILFALVCGGILLIAVLLSEKKSERTKLPAILIGGYLFRISIQFVVRDIQFFSHAAGGDCELYEEYGQVIARLWRAVGIHFVEADEVRRLGATTLPQNLFAF